MTMTEIRNHYRGRIRDRKRAAKAFQRAAMEEGIDYTSEITKCEESADWNKRQLDFFETLWKEGCVNQFDNYMLRYANGYQSCYEDFDNFSINQTLDLRSISATKTGVKRFGEWLIKGY